METQQSVARDAGCSQSAVSKTWYRQNGKITKGRSQSIWTENSKQYVLKMENCTTKEMKSKWSETGVPVTKTVLTTEEKKVLVGQRETVIDCDLMKHYSVMNYRSALSRELMLELLTCAFPVKYIRCKEEVANFSFQLYYWVAYMAGKRGEMASVTSRDKA